MARMNITIPDEIRQRMERYPHINWSKTAAESFVNAMNSGDETMNVDGMASAVARLIASKSKISNKFREKGVRDGLEWAMKYAEYSDLESLIDNCLILNQSGKEPKLSDLKIFGKIETHAYFDSINDDNHDYIGGFIRGCTEVFDKVIENYPPNEYSEAITCGGK